MPTYAPPSITVTSLGPQTPLYAGPAPATLMLIGTAPKGPDYPVLVSPAQMVSLYGDPSASASVGYTIPYAAQFAMMQAPPTGRSALQFLVCRVGVTRATYAVLDASAGTTMTLSGIGAYAGSAGTRLRATVAVTGGKVTTFTVTDNTTGATLLNLVDVTAGGNYDLSTNSNIVAAINGANPLNSASSSVIAALGASALVPAAVTAAPFTGGADGKGAAYNDTTLGAGGLLDQSLWTNADYVWAGFDAAQFGPTLLAHLNTALAQNQFRKGILGPVRGTTFGSLSGSYIGSSLQSSRLVVIAHDSAFGQHPALGTTWQWDGWMLAAAYAGLKAASPTESTGTGWSIGGFTALALPPDKTAALQQADLNALAGKGLLALNQQFGGPITVRDALTTAPLYPGTGVTDSGGKNVWSQFNIQCIDDAVSLSAIAYVAPLLGQPRGNVDELSMLVETELANAVTALGTTTNGLNGTPVVSIDPNTLAVNASLSYITRYPILTIALTTSFVFQASAA